MNINQVFPSKYIAAADLNGQQVAVTIERVAMEPVAQNEPPKPVLYFQGKKKGMVGGATLRAVPRCLSCVCWKCLKTLTPRKRGLGRRSWQRAFRSRLLRFHCR